MSRSEDRLVELEGMIFEMTFLSMKYARIMNDIEFYERLRTGFAVSSTIGEEHKNRLLEQAREELNGISNRLEDIKRELMEALSNA
jgi:hypothetical protein